MRDDFEASKEKLGLGQTILRWHIQSGRVVLPKSTNAQRIAQNLDLFEFSLDDAQMKQIDGLAPQEARRSTSPFKTPCPIELVSSPPVSPLHHLIKQILPTEKQNEFAYQRAVKEIVSRNGWDLESLSHEAPTLVVFLRHLNCIYCRESLAEYLEMAALEC